MHCLYVEKTNSSGPFVITPVNVAQLRACHVAPPVPKPQSALCVCVCVCASLLAAPPALKPPGKTRQEGCTKPVTLKVRLRNCNHYRVWWKRPDPLLLSAVSPASTWFPLKKKKKKKKTQAERNNVRKRARRTRERDGTDSHSRGPAVLRIRLSMNLINMASLICIREYSTEGHPLCSPPPSSHFDYTDA